MLRIVIVLILVAGVSAFAQEETRTRPIDPNSPIPSVPPLTLDTELPKDPSPVIVLLPSNDENAPDAPEGVDTTLPDIVEATTLEKSRALTARYREVRTKVEQMPEMVALREKADQATTFDDERAALRKYYRTLFAQIKKHDKSLETKCVLMEAAFLSLLEQKNIEPTVPRVPPRDSSGTPKKNKPVNP